MNPEDKERLIAEFCASLEDWNPQEDLQGDAVSDPALRAAPVNLALLFSELSVLRNEVRVEARQFKTALDDMRALTELLSEQNKRLTRELVLSRDTQSATQRQSERPLLLELLEVRDRLASAVALFEAYQPSWLARLASTETQLAQGLGQGIALTLRRVDDVLTERRVRPIEAVGGQLDPHTMRVVSVANDSQRRSGEVVGVARRGYLREDELLRLAEVIVNKT